MHIPTFATYQGFLDQRSERVNGAPAEDADPLPVAPAPRTESPPSVPPFARFGLGRRVVPFLVVAALCAGCGGRAAPLDSAPPAARVEGERPFLSLAVEGCKDTCAPRDAMWSATDVAGVQHVSCRCAPLPSLGTTPKVARKAAPRHQKAASLQDSVRPDGRVAVAEATR